MGIKKILVAGMAMGVVVSFCALSSLADSTGWQGNDSDGWKYYTSDSDYVKDDWKQISGKWYYFDEDGIALIDTWAIVEGKLYHFDSKGAMETGKWIECGEHFVHEDDWYKSYAGLKDWRYVGSDGAAYTGWKKVDGEWYCFDDGSRYSDEEQRNYYIGRMLYNYYTDEDGNLYNFDQSGHYRKNTWYKNEIGEWNYFGSDGIAYDGWHQIDGKWYYFGGDDLTDHYMCTGRRETYENGYEVWFFDENGVMQTGWCGYKKYVYDEETGEDVWNGDYTWFYARENGKCLHSEWLKDNGKWYYFDQIGRMIAGVDEYYIDGALYNFDSSGKCTNADNPKKINGWYRIVPGHRDGFGYEAYLWVYAENGVEYRNKWLQYNGSWYYFSGSGLMVQGEHAYDVNGIRYDFDDDGKCLNPDAIRITGWVQEDSSWYYFGSDGHKYSREWLNDNGKWYYFEYDGRMVTGSSSIWDEESQSYNMYYFNQSGAMITGWYNTHQVHRDTWIYADSDGVLYSNKWLNYKGEWYYFQYSHMVNNTENLCIDGKYYDFDENGICTNPQGRVQKLVIISNALH